MALRTFGAFVAGVGVGWVARSTIGSSREALVRAIVVAHRVREGARRVLAEQVEWAEDMFAEGRARYEMLRDHVPLDDEALPHVVVAGRPGGDVDRRGPSPSDRAGSRGRAA
jgi:hypothetical protein